MRRLDGGIMAGFILEPGETVGLSVLMPDDRFDRDTDLIIWKRHIPQNELEVISCWHDERVGQRMDVCRALRICDTGELRARVVKVSSTRNNGRRANENYRYIVEWLTPMPWGTT